MRAVSDALLESLAVGCPACQGGQCRVLFQETPPPSSPPPPFPKEVLQGLTLKAGYIMWMTFRDALADATLRQQLKPKLMCELFLLHQHPGRIEVDELQRVQQFFRTQNNRRYASLSTEQKLAKLQEREVLLKRVAEQEARLRAAERAKQDADVRAAVNARAAMIYARTADDAHSQMLYGGGFGARALAAVRAIPHCEAASSPHERFDPVGDTGVICGEDLGCILNIAHEQVTLDFECGRPGM